MDLDFCYSSGKAHEQAKACRHPGVPSQGSKNPALAPLPSLPSEIAGNFRRRLFRLLKIDPDYL